jgi:hypothetical protein
MDPLNRHKKIGALASNGRPGLLAGCLVLLFGVVYILVPVLKTVGPPQGHSQKSVAPIIFLMMGFLISPSLVYCLIAARTREILRVILPGIFLLAAEIYFFHDFKTWMASDANAAVGLLFIPVYLFIILGFAYGLAWAAIKFRNH